MSHEPDVVWPRRVVTPSATISYLLDDEEAFAKEESLPGTEFVEMLRINAEPRQTME